jgi:hypothetical protein
MAGECAIRILRAMSPVNKPAREACDLFGAISFAICVLFASPGTVCSHAQGPRGRSDRPRRGRGGRRRG